MLLFSSLFALLSYVLFGALLISIPVLFFTGWTDIHSFIFIAYGILFIASIIGQKILISKLIREGKKNGMSDFEISYMIQQSTKYR